MKKINIPFFLEVIIKILGLISIIVLLTILYFYFNDVMPTYPKIYEENVHDFVGGDLWSSVIKNFNKVEIKNLPVEASNESYEADLILKVSDKEEWNELSSEILQFVSEYLYNEPTCEINKSDSISIYIKDISQENYVILSNFDFSMESNGKKLDSVYLVSSDKNFLSFDDIVYYSEFKYIAAKVVLDNYTNFNVVKELPASVNLFIYVNESYADFVYESLKNLSANCKMNIIFTDGDGLIDSEEILIEYGKTHQLLNK